MEFNKWKKEKCYHQRQPALDPDRNSPVPQDRHGYYYRTHPDEYHNKRLNLFYSYLRYIQGSKLLVTVSLITGI